MLVGFSTHSGTVTAASEWDATAERKRVRPGLPGSYEDLFHQAGEARFWLPLRANARLGELLREKRLQRAIGVIYLPQSERTSHYFHTRLPAQFDALIHIDHTRAVQPLVPEPLWHAGEPAETYPSGL
jgi:erythromycin esterase-like protein